MKASVTNHTPKKNCDKNKVSAHNLGQDLRRKQAGATEACSQHVAGSDSVADFQDGLKCEQLQALYFLLFFCLVFNVQAASTEVVCWNGSRKLLVLPYKKSFLENNFLNDLFEELVGIINREQINISNTKVRDIIFRWDNIHNLSISDLFEVSNVFGVKTYNLLQYAGDLKNLIDPSKIIKDAPPFTLKQKHHIFDRVHLHLSGLINETLRRKNLTLEKLPSQTGIELRFFYGIVNDMALPHFPLLLKMLVKLDADVVTFFKNIEIGLEPKTLPPHFRRNRKSLPQFQKRGEIEKNAVDLFKKINREIEDILKGISLKDRKSDAMRFKHTVYYRNRYRDHYLEKNTEERAPTLADIIQLSRMLGINVSKVLKYAGNLKSHIRLDGIETRILLGDDEMKELLEYIHKHIVVMFGQSEISVEQLADITQIPLRQLKDIDRRGVTPLYSNLERILQALNSDSVRFFETLELKKGFNIHVSGIQFAQTHGLANEFVGARIMKIWEILHSFFSMSQLDKAMVRPVNQRTGLDLTQSSAIRFKTLYKTSRTANIPLSELVGDRPVEKIFNPLHAKVEPTPVLEIEKAERLLAHLFLREARRQKDINGLTVTGLAIKSNVTMLQVRHFLSGAKTPSYFILRQIAEKGLGVPLPRFLEDFETKLKSLKHIPKATKIVLLELEGPYFSKRVKTNLAWTQKRISQAKEFLKSANIPLNKLVSKGVRGDSQMRTLVKFSHLFGISLSDFLGRRNFSEMTKPDRLVFRRLSDERVLKAIGEIKRNINRRRKNLGISNRDLEIKLGISYGQKAINILFNESAMSFPLHRYFQLAEILAQDGEDDLFLLDDVIF